MVRSGPNTSDAQRQLVIYHNANGKSCREISRLLKIPKTTVWNIVQRFKNEDRIDLKKATGQPEKLSPCEKRFLLREVKKTPSISAPKLVSALQKATGKTVAASTIRQFLKRNGFHSRTARSKPYICKVNQKKRLDFAERYITEDESFWNRVIFTDESKYNVYGNDGKVKIWRKRNTALAVRNLNTTIKHGGGSVMVWGCFSAQGVGSLVFIEGTMNAAAYIQILRDNLHVSAEKMGIRRSFLFYQDNDPKHKARNTKEWLLYNCPKVLDTPPQSPDCNPIENLWDYLDDRIRERPISSKRDLKVRLEEEWQKIPVEYCRTLVSSMPRRLAAVIRAKGLHTKY